MKKSSRKIFSKVIKQNAKGITLIALIINIIVLLILATVSIATLTGDNGLLSKAQEAKEANDEAEEDDLRKLTAIEAATHLTNETIIDNSTGKELKVTIPAGFAVSQVEGENTIADGLVVIDQNGNEFVWVPVSDINEMAQCSQADGTCNLDLVNNEIVCTTHSNNEIVGKLYATTTGNSFDANTPNTTYDPNNGLREPAIVTGNNDGTGASYDGDFTNNLSIINIILGTTYTTANEFLSDMKKDYATMIKSVKKYDGFYISRYEMSKDRNNRAASVEGTPLVNDSSNKWYGLYAYGKTYKTSSVESSMVWGSQYDAMMIWMYNNGNGTDVKVNIGDNRNMTQTTGAKKDTDVINNIYDLYGCYYERTLEANDTYRRVDRGRFLQ